MYIDKHISAEIPDLTENQTLHNMVLKHMIHGPCGSWCKSEEGKCSKNFPKKFCCETIFDDKGHINVEVVSSIKSEKYLYKYIYKGHHAAEVIITENDCNERVMHCDEIQNFVETRYVSPVEACDRIFGRPL